MENKKLSYMPPKAEIILLYSEGILCASEFEDDNNEGQHEGNIGSGSGIW